MEERLSDMLLHSITRLHCDQRALDILDAELGERKVEELSTEEILEIFELMIQACK